MILSLTDATVAIDLGHDDDDVLNEVGDYRLAFFVGLIVSASSR